MPELTKVTVLLTEPAMQALNRAAQFDETSRPDIINRAVQLYAEVVTSSPSTLLTVTTPSGDTLQLVVLGGTS